jgi:branched-chain amino acid transport system permease protein
MKNIKLVALICGAIFVLGFPLVVSTSYYVHILFMVYLFAALGVGWNLIGGYGAQLSLGHSVFFAIGAYVPVLLMLNYNISPLIGGFVGVGLAVLAAALIGLPCFRLRGPYFALATIAAAEITRTLLLHFQNVTGGANGLPIPFRGENAFNLQFATKAPYYYMALALLVAVFLLVRYLEKERIGLYLAAIREDQDAAESLGVKTMNIKLMAFMLSAAIAAAAGQIYAYTVAYIDPDGVASINLSVEIAIVVIVGGIGKLWGPVLGSAVVILLTELTNIYLGAMRSGASLVLYGLLLIVVILMRPDGLISLFDRFSPELNKKGGK